MQILKEIRVDVAAKNTFQAIIAKQYDSKSRYLKVRLTDEGVDMNIPAGSVAMINAKRADGESASFTGTIHTDGTVLVPITYWMLSIDDTVVCDITVVGTNEDKLTSSLFDISVEAATNDNGDIDPEEAEDILVQIMSVAADAAQSAADAITAVDSKITYAQATGTLSTAFDNNLELKTVYHVGINPNQYHFVNLDDSTQLRYNANQGFELREKVSDTWGEWTPAIADGSISNDMLNSALQSAIVLANRSMQYRFLGNAEPSEFNSIFENNRNKDTIYCAGVGSYYYDFVNLSSDIQLRMSKAGIEVKNYSAATPQWTYLVEQNDRSKLLQMWADFDTKVYMDVVNLGELGETTSLDNEDYCLESRRYLFKAVNNLAGILHVPANTVCVLTNANGYQIVEPVNIAVKIIRKVNAVRPTFNADPWKFITKTLNSGEVLWDNLAVPVKTRITDLESGVTDLASGKLDYIDDSDNTIWTTAALNSYDFDSDKLYQVMLNGTVLGAYEPAQIALVFQSDSFTRIIIGAKSGVFYSTYDSQTEEWSDPVKSLDKATERQLNNFEQRISALETANTILSNAINGVS